MSHPRYGKVSRIPQPSFRGWRLENHFDSVALELTRHSSLFVCYDAVTMAFNMPAPRFASAPLAGMLLAATAFALMTSVDTIFKLMTGGHPSYQILLISGCFSILPIIGWAFLTGGLQRLHTERPFLHFIRGSIGVLSSYCAIYAYARLPLADFYAIVFSGPLLVTVLSYFLLKEKIEAKRWLAIAIGFCGVLLVTHPDTETHGVTAMAGRIATFLSVACYAISVVMIRRMRIGESNLAFSFYGFVASTFIGGSILLIAGAPDLSTADFVHLMISGFLSGTASICLMTAYHRSPVAVVAPFQYTQIFWGALAGWLIWHQLPGQRLIGGAAIVAVSGLFLIYREMQFQRTDNR